MKLYEHFNCGAETPFLSELTTKVITLLVPLSRDGIFYSFRLLRIGWKIIFVKKWLNQSIKVQCKVNKASNNVKYEFIVELKSCFDTNLANNIKNSWPESAMTTFQTIFSIVLPQEKPC